MLHAHPGRGTRVGRRGSCADTGKRYRGRRLSNGGARARFYHDVLDARLAKIIKVNLKSELCRFQIDRIARRLAKMMDGKLLLVSNAEGLSAEEIVSRYKSRADSVSGSFHAGPIQTSVGHTGIQPADLCWLVCRSRAAHTDVPPNQGQGNEQRTQQ